MRTVIVGTAGHVDHGKTELIKALTGRDTDRLREEKERGISIVLGFAPLDLGEDLLAGVVDVPGHERFVKNMVSGAIGVDLALVVVAADEGVMPQTEEHLEVLRLLGVSSGVIAITKTDLVEPDLIEIVESEMRDLLGGTPMAESPFVHTSAVTGRGLDQLRDALRRQALSTSSREGGDFFRLPVDRIFTRSGIGTIVTGTTWTGGVGKGDELVVEPAGRRVRVREVQSFERSLERAAAGMRVALALHGVRVGELEIGCQIVTPGVLQVSSIMDAAVEVGVLKGSRLRSRQRVRFHHAAGEIMARIVLLGQEELSAGDRGFVQLRLEKPSLARRGDRFVLRTYSPMRVVAGGTILDPTAGKKRHGHKDDGAVLEKLLSGSPGEVVRAIASRGGMEGVPAGVIRRYGLSGDDVQRAVAALEDAGSVFTVGGRILDAAAVAEKEKEIIGLVRAFASRNRLIWGMEREELKEKAGLSQGPVFEFLLNRVKTSGGLFFKGSMVRAGGGERELSAEDAAVLEEIERRAKNAAPAFVTGADLKSVVADGKRLGLYIRILEERDSIVRIAPEAYLHTAGRDGLLAMIRGHLERGGTLSVGDFKELCGFSRKYAVPILEYLDAEGYTRREGDARIAGPRLEQR